MAVNQIEGSYWPILTHGLEPKSRPVDGGRWA